MNEKNSALALRGSACLKKATAWLIRHPLAADLLALAAIAAVLLQGAGQ